MHIINLNITGFDNARNWDQEGRGYITRMEKDKPLSLYPLKPEEALEILLKIKPPKKKKKDK
ncbi:hypothetical protein ACFL6I_21365 [candidate division KSB1 bacterium]